MDFSPADGPARQHLHKDAARPQHAEELRPAVRANMDSTQSNPPSANGRWAAVAVSQWAPRSRAAA